MPGAASFGSRDTHPERDLIAVGIDRVEVAHASAQPGMRARGLARLASQRKLATEQGGGRPSEWEDDDEISWPESWPGAPWLPLTIPHLTEQTNDIWRLIGDGAFAPACDVLRQIDRQLKTLTP
ncbi:hypothetical protein I3J27_09545 [Bradyrhizobium xenonodulans]|uniref:Uncharacterized protein n=1 Tax=Bradyrhizobium xenonodulans TaxID=2736875 RepID=A0ABY7MQG2_9BRAD|nr:hypothetical protein [Bradyrhizobium xenonodulans]WBL80646.1 hypothetical protein I3J27_09545 [Bradyrhizobium xenonodulans]